jgi:ATP-dependent Clp protease protease subunit
MAIVLPTPKDRRLIFNKDVTQDTIGELSKQILEIDDDDVYISKIYSDHGLTYTPFPIKIYIDSHGGQVYHCFGLLGVMDKSKTPIHTIVTGCAMSAGFMISITGHKRFAYDKATLMYHQLYGASFGKLKDITEKIVESERLMNIIEQHVLDHTKISKTKLKQIFDAKFDWYLDAKEAIKYGVIDEII